MQTSLPLVQFFSRPGSIDLSWGHPDPTLLPVDGLRAAATRVFKRYGPDALNYGHAAGPGPLIAWLCERIGEVDGRRATPDEIVISAGNSHALDQIAMLFSRPGDAVLVESPTYHLAIRILRDHPVELVSVPTDQDGLQVDVLPDIVARVRRGNRGARLILYTIPTFHNPTSASLSLERRRRLVELATSEHVLIVEDDAYRELSYDGASPPSLWSLAPPGVVIRLGSFAKSLAPGLRSGFITADAATITHIRNSGVLDSGGAISHFSSLVIAEFAISGDYARNVDRLRQAYTDRRDALLAALRTHLADRATWRHASGGYFVWLTLPPGHDTTALVAAADAAGTGFVPGSTFYLRPEEGRRFIRLSFSRYPPERVAEAAHRLSAVL